MKHLSKFLLGALLLTGVQFASSGCVSDGYVSESVYYGPRHRDPWFHDDPWMDGRRGYYREAPRRGSGSVDVYISPPPPPRAFDCRKCAARRFHVGALPDNASAVCRGVARRRRSRRLPGTPYMIAGTNRLIR